MRLRGNDQNKSYQYYFIGSTIIVILIPEEYFFPYFNNTIDFIENKNFFKCIKTIIIDFRRCEFVHGIGLGLEVQLYYEKSVASDKVVYWLGNKIMHGLIKELCMVNYNKKIIPYRSSFEEIIN